MDAGAKPHEQTPKMQVFLSFFFYISWLLQPYISPLWHPVLS